MKKLIVGNWKLNPVTLKEAKQLAAKIDRRPRHTTVICPPAVFLSSVDYPSLGGQDVFWMAKGPYTGQTSPLTLKSFKVRYCIVGHSERRMLGESDLDINQKIVALLGQGITPIVCVGYGTTVQQDDLEVIDVLRDQLAAVLKEVDTNEVVVAYEPVWAISSGDPYHHKVATSEHAERIALFIKTKHGVGRVLYGGSVTMNNAGVFLSQSNIDGLLVGGASLLPADFNVIINMKV